MDLFRQVLPHEWEQAIHVLSENFLEDPLYQLIFSDDKTRFKALNVFFSAYVELLLPYSVLMTDSDEMNLVALAYFSNRCQSKWVYRLNVVSCLIKCLPLVFIIGFKDTLNTYRTLKRMSSEWIDSQVFGDYVHLDLVVVKQSARGQGWFTKWLKFVEENYVINGETITLETQNAENTAKYAHLGFQVVASIPLKDTSLVQYCMVKGS